LDNLQIKNANGGVIFTVKVVPGSSRTSVSGLLNGMVKIKVSAPPEKGKANQSLIEFLAKKLGVKKNVVSIISGKTNPVKDIQILGMSTAILQKKLGLEK